MSPRRVYAVASFSLFFSCDADHFERVRAILGCQRSCGVIDAGNQRRMGFDKGGEWRETRRRMCVTVSLFLFELIFVLLLNLRAITHDALCGLC